MKFTHIHRWPTRLGSWLKARLYAKLPARSQAVLYRKTISKRLEFPFNIYLETTNACNLNCVMCPTQRPQFLQHRAQGFMDKRLFQRLVDEIARERPSARVYLHKDGEPLLHPEILGFIDYASNRLNNVMLVTNATLLTEQMARDILSTRLQHIRFSVDGLTKDTFEKIRKQDRGNPYADTARPVDYETVAKNIRRFCRLRAELGQSTPRTGVRTTSFRATADELSEYRRFWRRRVDTVNIVKLLSWSGEISAAHASAKARYPCLNLWGHTVVTWEGMLVPCCVFVDKADSGKGNLADLNTCTLREAWHSASLNRLRLAHIENSLEDFPFCATCGDWETPMCDHLWTPKVREQLLEAARRAIAEATA